MEPTICSLLALFPNTLNQLLEYNHLTSTSSLCSKVINQEPGEQRTSGLHVNSSDRDQDMSPH